MKQPERKEASKKEPVAATGSLFERDNLIWMLTDAEDVILDRT